MGRKQKKSNRLTEFELQIMAAIWRRGSATVADVRDQLGSQKDFAYTTVSTMMRLLEQKGALSSLKNGRVHIYVPELTQESYEKMLLSQISRDLFQDDPAQLVGRLMDTRELSLAELEELKLLIETRIASHS